MKAGWTYKKLGEVVKPINGLWKGKKEPFVHVGVIRNANFTKDFTLNFDNIEYLDVEQRQYATRKLKKGDLIVEKSGGSEKQPVGRAVLFLKDEGEFSFSNFTSVLRITDANSLSYLFLYKYLLFVYKRGDTKKMQNAATGIHNIIWDMYLGIDVPIPSISEQERIVAYLDTQFAKIDAMKANAAKALAEAKALFQSALTEAMTPKEGWEMKKIGDVFRSFSGGTPLKSVDEYYKGGNIPWLRSGEVCKKYIYETEMFITEEGMKNSSAKYYPIDTVVVAMYGATAAQVGILKISSTSNQAVCGLLPNSDNLPEFVYYWFRFRQDFLASQAQGGAQPNISQIKIKNLDYPIMPLPEQECIVTRLDALSAKVAALEANYTQTVAECDALKQALLREVFE